MAKEIADLRSELNVMQQQIDTMRAEILAWKNYVTTIARIVEQVQKKK